MSVYLLEDEVGFDKTLVGFPSIDGCLAIVVKLEHGLYGFHVPPGHEARTSIMKTMIIENRCYGKKLALFGSCKWNNRYAGVPNKFLQWADEMKRIATLIGFEGTINGYDLTSEPSIPAVAAAVYVEFRYVRNEIEIFYNLMSILTQERNKDPTTLVLRVNRDASTSKPYLNKVTTKIAGAMIKVEQKGFYSFIAS